MSYTPGEVTKFLGIPGSTLRRYVSTFGDYLSHSAKKRRGREFTDKDVAVLTRIRDLASQGRPLNAIGPELDKVFDTIPNDAELPPQTALAVIQRMGVSINQRFDDVEARLRAIEEAEAERHKKRPWWRKLFGS